MPEHSGEYPSCGERRKNLELRERLDEIVALARKLCQDRESLSHETLEEIRLRIEWLAEEIWAAAAYGPLEERVRHRTPEPGEYISDE
jgi:Lon protease-like protein